MAKKRQRSYPSDSNIRGPRDVSSIASPEPFFELFRLRPLSTHPRSGQDLRVIEDRRVYSPGRVKPSRTPRQVARVLMASSSPKSPMNREVLSFKIPRSTAVCVRRSIRKQVIHAKRRAGTKVRRPRRNAMSSISCKRR